jgi:hypothetical protein
MLHSKKPGHAGRSGEAGQEFGNKKAPALPRPNLGLSGTTFFWAV